MIRRDNRETLLIDDLRLTIDDLFAIYDFRLTIALTIGRLSVLVFNRKSSIASIAYLPSEIIPINLSRIWIDD